MKTSNTKPPCHEDCIKAFGEEAISRAVFTYGLTIFNPGGYDIPDHLAAHESVHGDQQKHDETVAKLWWQRYLADPKFRLEQEVEAYRAQYKFICEKTKDRNTRYRALHQIATDLSGKMYGNLISFTEAIRRIRD